jgi:hypothetical protein
MGTVDALRAGYATFILSLLGTALVVSAILSGSSSPDADSEAVAAQVEHVRAAPRALTVEPATGCLPGRRQAQRSVTAAGSSNGASPVKAPASSRTTRSTARMASGGIGPKMCG